MPDKPDNFLRTCVFCGQQPTNRNREHILPQWLLALTGDPKRVVSLGYDYHKGKPREFAISQFVVPACTACNYRYAEFETLAKGIC
jgi:hypothetical protein